MKSKKEIRDSHRLPPITEILLRHSTERSLLILINDDPKFFASKFQIDMHLLLSRGGQTKEQKDNYTNAVAIFFDLVRNGKVDNSKALTNRITWKGRYYLWYTHPALTFWATVVSVATFVVSLLIILRPEQSKPPLEQTKQPILDSPSGHEKKTVPFVDDSLKKKDTLPPVPDSIP